jgi:hypothetical protein
MTQVSSQLISMRYTAWYANYECSIERKINADVKIKGATKHLLTMYHNGQPVDPEVNGHTNTHCIEVIRQASTFLLSSSKNRC